MPLSTIKGVFPLLLLSIISVGIDATAFGFTFKSSKRLVSWAKFIFIPLFTGALIGMGVNEVLLNLSSLERFYELAGGIVLLYIGTKSLLPTKETVKKKELNILAIFAGISVDVCIHSLAIGREWFVPPLVAISHLLFFALGMIVCSRLKRLSEAKIKIVSGIGLILISLPRIVGFFL